MRVSLCISIDDENMRIIYRKNIQKQTQHDITASRLWSSRTLEAREKKFAACLFVCFAMFSRVGVGAGGLLLD